jgi:hypothetical protein
MVTRAAVSWIVAALSLGGLAGPAALKAAPSHAGVPADIWVRLFPAPKHQVKAAIYVHTAIGTRCTSGISGADGKGKGVVPQPAAAVTGDDGIALFRYFFPSNAKAGRRSVTANCTIGEAQIVVGSSFYLPYNAKANAVPPSAPLKVLVPRMTVSQGTTAAITIHTLAGALCTGLVEGETGNGIARTVLDPAWVSAAGTVSWNVRPSFTGIGSIAVTCDLHKTFSRGEASITVQ